MGEAGRSGWRDVHQPTATPCALIDWDLAAPAPPRWDLAGAAYRFVPLYDDATCDRLGFRVGRPTERLRILCDAYGLREREALLPTVRKASSLEWQQSL